MESSRRASGVNSIALLGSGEFGVPSFEAIRVRSAELGVRIACVVSQPDRKAGRGQESHETPVSRWAITNGLRLIRSENVNEFTVRESIRGDAVRLLVVIAFGQRLGNELLEGVAAINLHGSLLPAWRGAAPIQRSLMAGDARVGVSVIEVAHRMDAGVIYATAEAEPMRGETAGELHDRLALVGVEPLLGVVAQWASTGLCGRTQDDSKATHAKKLSRADAWVDFARTGAEVASRINGLSPWPGVDATIEGHPLKILRARVFDLGEQVAKPNGLPGEILPGGAVACAIGSVELLEVQPPGGRATTLAAFLNGRRLGRGSRGVLRIHSAPRTRDKDSV
ncbi:MAG: methionyl-tRNA formyltransferase [Phycisphaerales bacterium]|nr:methionyl-tRNA formyltransferase [Phycisphaerales bacterium]